MAAVERWAPKADIWAILSAINSSAPVVPAFPIATVSRDPSRGDVKLATECLSLSVRSEKLGISVEAWERREIPIVLMADCDAARNGLETDLISSLSSMFVHTL